MARAVGDLGLAPGAGVLDAGCGTGSQLPLLAGHVKEGGRVTGLDLSAELLEAAARKVSASGLGDIVSLVQGDLYDLPFEDGEFDCVVSVDCAGYPFCTDPPALLRELGRVTRPGGTVALLGWTYQLLLPGYPLLESKLNTASSLAVPSDGGPGPGSHFLRAPGWFREAGYVDSGGRSYAGDINGPLDDERKEAVAAFFEMLWSGARGAVSDGDWELFQRLSSPGADDFLPGRSDYYGFFVYSCFSATVPAG